MRGWVCIGLLVAMSLLCCALPVVDGLIEADFENPLVELREVETRLARRFFDMSVSVDERVVFACTHEMVHGFGAASGLALRL